MPTLIETGDGTTLLGDSAPLERFAVPEQVIVDAFYLQDPRESRMPVKIIERTVFRANELRGITTFLDLLECIRTRHGELDTPSVVSAYDAMLGERTRGHRIGTYILPLGPPVGVQHVLTNGYRPSWIASGVPTQYPRKLDRLLVPHVDVVIPDADMTDECMKEIRSIVPIGEQGRTGVYVALLGSLAGCHAPDVVLSGRRIEAPGFRPFVFGTQGSI